jgi:hypothetical protein
VLTAHFPFRSEERAFLGALLLFRGGSLDGVSLSTDWSWLLLHDSLASFESDEDVSETLVPALYPCEETFWLLSLPDVTSCATVSVRNEPNSSTGGALVLTVPSSPFFNLSFRSIGDESFMVGCTLYCNKNTFCLTCYELGSFPDDAKIKRRTSKQRKAEKLPASCK